jgi:hypothetical protein
MNEAYIDWLALLAILVVLGLIAYHFSVRTFRIAAFAAIVGGILAVTTYGMTLPAPRPANFAAALQVGGNTLARVMFAPILPGNAPQMVNPGLVGWIGLLVVLGGVLIWFDTWCVRRDPPRVDIPNPPMADPRQAQPELEERRKLAEELRFRLPAVEVRRPAAMPGGSTLTNLARIVSDSDIRGSKTTAAAMLVVNALTAKPRRYEVRTYVESCTRDGKVQPGSDYRLITVDMRDAKTGQSLAVRVLKPCRLTEAAERVAGFTARQAFRQDVWTPAWAAGSPDGDDLSAYLLSQERQPAGRTLEDSRLCRQKNIEILEQAVKESTNAGMVQYELACLYDLDERTLESLLLHLGNRTHHPRFLRGRYRLAMSLSMLTTDEAFVHQWPDALKECTSAGDQPARAVEEQEEREKHLDEVKEHIVRDLEWSGMLRRAGQPNAELVREPPPDPDAQKRIKLALLALARNEFRAYRWRLRAPSLLWLAFWCRAERSALLQVLHTKPYWLRHPRRRLLAASIALTIVKQRTERLKAAPKADERLLRRQRRVCRQLAVPGLSDGKQIIGRGWLSGPRAWKYGKIPWQALYNGACLCGLPTSGGAIRPEAVRAAVTLLRLAVNDPSCELVHPSEWIQADPDLENLRRCKEFCHFVHELERRDFAFDEETCRQSRHARHAEDCRQVR